MMKLQQKRLAAVINTLTALVPECRLTITDIGINVIAVDTANVALVSVNLPAASFQEYREEPAEIGMDLTKWLDMLKVMKEADSTIRIERLDTGNLRISDGKYTYTHAPLDPNTLRKKPNPPLISLSSSVSIDAKEFHDTIKALGVVGDKAQLSIDGGRFELTAEGDTDVLRKEIPTKPQDKKNGAAVGSLFSLDYLNDISKAMKDAGTVTVHLGENHPVRFDFEMGGFEGSYLVAPRIENDGDA